MQQGMKNAEAFETQLAHMQKTIDELSDVVARQDAELDQLKRQVTALITREAEREAEAGGSVVLGDQRPPHW